MKIILVFAISILFIVSCQDSSELEIISGNYDQVFSQKDDIILKFSKDINDKELLYSWTENDVLLFEPKIEGSIKWNSLNELVFHPEKEYLPNTTYKIQINKEIKKLFDSVKTVSNKRVSFKSLEFDITKINSQWQVNSKDYSKDKLGLQLSFSYKINPIEVSNKIKFIIDDKKIDFNITNTEVSKEIYFELDIVDAKKFSEKELIIELEDELLIYNSDWKSTNKITKKYKIPSIDDLFITNSQISIVNNKSLIRLYTNQSLDAKLFNDSLIILSPSIKFNTEITDFGLNIIADFESGKTYELILKKELTSIYGRNLDVSYSSMFTFSNIEPSINFKDKDMIYLSNIKSKNIGLHIVGLDSIQVKITKIYENNLLEFFRHGKEYDYEYMGDEWISYSKYRTKKYGDVVSEEILDLKKMNSNSVVKVIDLNIKDKIEKQGLYVVTVSSNENNWLQRSQLVSLSDIGLIVKKSKNDLYVFVNRISSAESMAGVDISIVSEKNQIEHKTKTNNKGIAIIKNYNTNGVVDVSPAMIIAKYSTDVNYLPLNHLFKVKSHEYDTYGASADEYKTFLYGDRNLYRPGDTIVFSGILRDKDWRSLSNVPIIVKVKSPNGNLFKEYKLNLNDESGFESKIYFPTNVLTGTYSVEYYLNENIFLDRYIFKVEEFMPDRLKINITSNKKEYLKEDSIHINAQVFNLFGTIARNRKYELELVTSKKYLQFDKFKNYEFNISNLNNISYDAYNKFIEGRTDEEGEVKHDINIDGLYNNNGILDSKINLTVFDENGRPVNKSLNINILTQDEFCGIGDFEYYNSVGNNISVPLVVIDKNQKLLLNKKINVQIVKFKWNSVLIKSSNGNYSYKSQKEEVIQIDKDIIFNDRNNVFSFKTEDYGEYEVRVKRDGDKNYISKGFYCYYWGNINNDLSGNFQIDKEGKITIETEKDEFNSNEKCKIIFKTPFDGKLLVTLERNGIYYNRYLETSNKSVSLMIDLKDEYIPNVYITAILFKKLDNGAMPLTVAYGYKSITVENKKNKIDLEIIAPNKIQSNTKQKIKIKSGLKEKDIFITLSAVDEGILQITNFKTPNPYNFFYRRYGLDISSYSIYPYLYPDLVLNKNKNGGDDYLLDTELDGRTNTMANKRVKLLAKWSGILKTDRNGIVETEFEIPQFSGAVRLMAVAYKDKAFGSAEKEMKIVDPIVISSSVPRFLSPKDSFDLVVTLSNTESNKTNAKVSLELDKLLGYKNSLTQNISLNPNSEEQLTFKIYAKNNLGSSKIKIKVFGHNQEFNENTDITIRQTSSIQIISGFGQLKSGKIENLDLVSNFIPGTNKSKVVISKSPLINQLNNLSELLKYPYGCLEQTVSAVFPQLYFKDLLEISDDKFAKNSIYVANENINKAISKLYSMQQYDGGLSYWQGINGSNMWGSIYAAHFLTEAKKAGYSVSNSFLEKLYEYIHNECLEKNTTKDYYYSNGSWVERNYYSRNIFYGLYVLSIAGKYEKSTMNLYKSKLKYLSEDCKFLLASSYKLVGDVLSYNEILPKTFVNDDIKRNSGGSLASNVRNMALSLYTLIETDISNPLVKSISNKLLNVLKSNHYLSTQDRSFTLLSLGKLASKSTNNNADGEIIAKNKTLPLNNKKFRVEKFEGVDVSIKSTGKDELFYFWESIGISKNGDYKEVDSKIKVNRNYLDREGKKLNSNIKQGELIVVELNLSLIDNVDDVENIAISDLLPAGFEIDNPRLNSSPSYPWMKGNEPEYIDIRDDRVNLFTSLNTESNTKKFYYICRAVTKGTFNLGVISADAMYDGTYRSLHGGGQIKIE